MKRNYPLDSHDHDECDDDKIEIERRLNLLFKQQITSTSQDTDKHFAKNPKSFIEAECDSEVRLISATRIGNWIPERRHVRLDSLKGLDRNLTKHDEQENYFYMQRFEALYCLEMSKLIITFNGIPLSLAEAYQLLLDNERFAFMEYIVFRHVNRAGYICLAQTSVSGDREKAGSINEPAFTPTGNFAELGSNNVYQVYKRESFVSKRKILECPEFKLIVLARSSLRNPFDLNRLLTLGSNTLNMEFGHLEAAPELLIHDDGNKWRSSSSSNESSTINVCDETPNKSLDMSGRGKQTGCSEWNRAKASVRCIIGLLDDDLNICFVEFKQLNDDELELKIK